MFLSRISDQVCKFRIYRQFIKSVNVSNFPVKLQRTWMSDMRACILASRMERTCRHSMNSSRWDSLAYKMSLISCKWCNKLSGIGPMQKWLPLIFATEKKCLSTEKYNFVLKPYSYLTGNYRDIYYVKNMKTRLVRAE